MYETQVIQVKIIEMFDFAAANYIGCSSETRRAYSTKSSDARDHIVIEIITTTHIDANKKMNRKRPHKTTTDSIIVVSQWESPMLTDPNESKHCPHTHTKPHQYTQQT